MWQYSRLCVCVWFNPLESEWVVKVPILRRVGEEWSLGVKKESLKRKRVELDERNEYTKVEFMLILSRMQFCSRRLGERER